MWLQKKIKKKIDQNKNINIKLEIQFDVNEKCYQIWKTLKKALCDAFILTYFNFNKFFILYINENKKKEYEATIHQINKNDVKKSMLFISRDLIDVETKYWAIKLETKTFIWVLTKLS